MTQQRLADIAGLHVRTIRGIETGHISHPRSDTVNHISRALALTPGERLRFRAAWGLTDDVSSLHESSESIDQDIIRRKLQESFDSVQTVALNETIWIGPDRRTTHRQTQEVTLGLIDSVKARYVFYNFLDEPIDLAKFHLSDLQNCSVGEEHVDPLTPAKLFELRLDRSMSKGDSRVLRYSADFVGARVTDEAGPLDAQEIAGFQRSPASYLLEVRFHPSAVPAHCVQVFQAHPRGTIQVVNTLSQTADNSTHLSLTSPRPGGHGIAWSWDS